LRGRYEHTALALAAAALGGMAGLALEVLWLAALGPALGHGRATPVGLGVFLAGWALGAATAGRAAARGARPARWALGGGALAALASALTLAALVRSPAAVPVPVALAGLFVTAFGQGIGLPLLAAAFGMRLVWAANLAGSVLGGRLAAWDLPEALGRLGATWVAAASALGGGLLGAFALRRVAGQSVGSGAPRRGIRLEVALLMGLGVAHLVVVQGVGFRLAGVWFGGHQDSAALILVASLLSLAAGAALCAPLLPRGPVGVALVLGAASLGSLVVGLGPASWLGYWPWIDSEVLDLAALARARPLALAVALVAPALVPLGALVPALARCAPEREVGPGAALPREGRRPDNSVGGSSVGGFVSGSVSGSMGGSMGGHTAPAVGALLLHEAWGGLAAACLFPWLLVPRFGLAGALAVGTGALAFALAAAFILGRRRGQRSSGAFALAAAGAAVCAFALARSPSPALAAPRLANPAYTFLSFHEDADYAVSVVHDGLRDERTLLTDDFRATATGDDYLYMQALGHVPVLLHPAPKRVAVLALGTGTTVGAVARHGAVERIDVLELSRAVVAAAPHFADVNAGALAEGLPGLLDADDGEARVVVHLGDGRRLLRDLAAREGAVFDVLTMEPLLPDAPFAVHLYTEGFYRDARRALAPGGLTCQWVPPHALAPPVFEAVLDAFSRAHPWSASFLYGTQLLLVGGEREPALDPARFEALAALAAQGLDLAPLGLEDPSGLAAFCIASPVAAAIVSRGATRGEQVPVRPLTDADPWIVYRPRPRGVEALGYLPANLARLAGQATPLSEAWATVVGAGGAARREVRLLVLQCRVSWAREVFASVSRRPATAADLSEVGRLRRQLAGQPFERDPAVRWLDAEFRFEHSQSQGLGALAVGDFEGALEHLTRAATERPRRADVHLYIAAAAAREAARERAAGRPTSGVGEVAVQALARSLELCPRILATRAGERALALGLDALADAVADTLAEAARARRPGLQK